MNEQSYVTFKLNQLRYGIPAIAVQEIFFLPEVTPISEVPTVILGMINLRGNLLPVLDLCRRLGQPRSPLHLTDSVVVLEWLEQRAGIIVSQVDAVQAIAADQINTSLNTQLEMSLQDDLLSGIANLEGGIVMLINPESLVSHAVAQTISPPTNAQNGALKDISDSGSALGLYNHFDAQDRQILRERMLTLQDAIAEQDDAARMPLAVVGLGGEYFGFELETVYEFTDIRKITLVPCCPSHVVGNINLRGEVVTLININDVIDLPMKAVRSRPQAVVVRLDQRVAGITVDEIFDVTYVHPSQVTPAPIALRSAKNDYLQGVVPYQGRMMTIISLSKLLTSDVLVVNEEA